jgi:hypothetical protein
MNSENWIDVKDRLPDEEGTQYICSCSHNYKDEEDLVIALIWDDQGWGEDMVHFVDWNKYVNHWMPLPQSWSKDD